jgi:hypothetical protein
VGRDRDQVAWSGSKSTRVRTNQLRFCDLTQTSSKFDGGINQDNLSLKYQIIRDY